MSILSMNRVAPAQSPILTQPQAGEGPITARNVTEDVWVEEQDCGDAAKDGTQYLIPEDIVLFGRCKCSVKASPGCTSFCVKNKAGKIMYTIQEEPDGCTSCCNNNGRGFIMRVFDKDRKEIMIATKKCQCDSCTCCPGCGTSCRHELSLQTSDGKAIGFIEQRWGGGYKVQDETKKTILRCDYTIEGRNCCCRTDDQCCQHKTIGCCGNDHRCCGCYGDDGTCCGHKEKKSDADKSKSDEDGGCKEFCEGCCGGLFSDGCAPRGKDGEGGQDGCCAGCCGQSGGSSDGEKSVVAGGCCAGCCGGGHVGDGSSTDQSAPAGCCAGCCEPSGGSAAGGSGGTTNKSVCADCCTGCCGGPDGGCCTKELTVSIVGLKNEEIGSYSNKWKGGSYFCKLGFQLNFPTDLHVGAKALLLAGGFLFFVLTFEPESCCC